jgi:hypothetical protein
VDKSSHNIWLKAAVAGGLWASFEIIVGSFLHNIHMPFSGTTLATFSVILMIAFLQIWPLNGLIWRAGIICGLMKSLSPSAVILGPMTGIMMEAIIMDLMIYLLGKNILGYLAAGAGALLSAILHKASSLLILYGTDVINIYTGLFDFFKEQLSISNIKPADLLIGIALVYIALGTVAAASGFFLGKYSVKTHLTDPMPPIAVDPFASGWNKTDPNQPFRIFLLILHILFLPGMLMLLNKYGLKPVAMIPVFIYIILSVLYYKQIIHRLKKPFFWSQLIIMTIIAGLFWHSPEAASGNLRNGYMVGLEMSLRAVLVITAFSGLSVEIRNPMVTKVLFKSRLRNGYAALSLAFNSLPAMLDRSAKVKTFFRKHVQSFLTLLYEAELWLTCFQTHLEK